jgi:hypothetical protein
MKKVSLILSAVVMTAMMVSSCTGNGKHEDDKYIDYLIEGETSVKTAEFPRPWNNDSFFREMIYDGLKEQYDNIDSVTFARHYIIVYSECGTGCVSGWMIDVRNGNQYELPQLSFWEGNGNLGSFYSPNHSLIIQHQEVVNFDLEEISMSTGSWRWIEDKKKFELVYPMFDCQ